MTTLRTQIIDTQGPAPAFAEAWPDLRDALHGWLYENGQKGKKFDSSSTATSPFEFRSARSGDRRWDEGVAHEGRRQAPLLIPPALGTARRSRRRGSRRTATLMFDVDLWRTVTQDKRIVKVPVLDDVSTRIRTLECSRRGEGP